MHAFASALLAPPIRVLRRVLGVEAIFQQNLQMQLELGRLWQVAADAAWLSVAVAGGCLDAESVKQTVWYARATELLRLLCPMDVTGAAFTRVGGDGDGGYVMLDDIDPRATPVAYSLGIGGDVTWDHEIAERGIDVYMYDDTVVAPPQSHRRFHFRKVRIAAESDGPGRRTITDILDADGQATRERMLLKCDIEGAEWAVFAGCPPEIMGRFSQIVVEWHGLAAALHGPRYAEVRGVLDRLHETHQAVHVHGNNCSIVYAAPRIVLPDVLEVTYVSRAIYGDRLVESRRQFPTTLDVANNRDRPELPLGDFGRWLVGRGPGAADQVS